MKTTIELPDTLMKLLKLRAVSEGRSLKSLLTELLTDALNGLGRTVSDPQEPYGLPVLKGRPAKKGKEMTLDRVAEILWGSGE